MIEYTEETIKGFTNHVSYRIIYDKLCGKVIELNVENYIYTLYYCDYDSQKKDFMKYMWIACDGELLKINKADFREIAGYNYLTPSKLRELDTRENILQYISLLNL